MPLPPVAAATAVRFMIDPFGLHVARLEVLEVVFIALQSADATEEELDGEEPLLPYEVMTDPPPTNAVTVPKS